MQNLRLGVLYALLLILIAPGAAAQTSRTPLKIATKDAPPFALRGEDGEWEGISISLWETVADSLGIEYTWDETDLAGMLTAMEEGTHAAGVGALTLTGEREKAFDFTHPFHISGLGIAVRSGETSGTFSKLRSFASLQFLQVVGLLFVVLLTVGVLIWLFERKRNPEHFGGSAAEGITSGFWWSAVTMTTVGYGDKAPSTLAGRIVGLLWMFVGIIIISSFTAAMTTALTVSQLESAIGGPEDLPSVRVGTVGASTSAAYLDGRRVKYREFESTEDALGALAREEVDAVVYDAPILRYLVNQAHAGLIHVLAAEFETQYYGIAIPENSPLRDQINRVLLETIDQPHWQDTLYRYLGD
ncbi:MAG: polar amino acid transport system substrate-binding protein [Rhodothermales bacterium]|jgi:polar amino acid transport system substrate-binding protein